MKHRQSCTMADVARHVGVSREVVSAVLHNGKFKGIGFSEETAGRVRSAIKELGYRPNGAARAMRRRESRHVGVLMSGAYTSPYEFPVIIGITEVFQSAGYSLSILDASGMDASKADETLAFKEQILDGMFVMHVSQRLEDLASASAPRHLHLDSNVREPHNCIYRDEREAGRLAVEGLAGMGHKRAIYLTNLPWKDCHAHMSDRLAGVSEAAERRGVEIESFEMGLDLKAESFRAPEFLRALKRTPCVVAVDYGLAQWCGNVAAKEGLCAGRDFSLASCSESFNCEGVWPWLSRVSFDRFDLGRKAAGMMLKLLSGGESIPSVALKGFWIEGETILSQAGHRLRSNGSRH